MSKLAPLVLLPFLFLLACSGNAPAGDRDGGVGATDFLLRLSRDDHRFLDTLEVAPPLLGAVGAQHASLPYALGRALEARGRRAAAEVAYEFSFDAGVAPWDGFAAARRGAIALERGDFVAAHAWGLQGSEVQPQNRDLWYLRGEGLYRAGEYAQLIEMILDMPESGSMLLGEIIAPERIREERALWGAVAHYEIDPFDTTAFVDAFLTVPADTIHTRLYLYLFYRDGALGLFEPQERLLMEAVYRVAREEYSEALRLLTMIEPDAFGELLSSIEGESGGDTLPGVLATLDRAVTVDRRGVTPWLDRIAEVVRGDGVADATVVAALDLVRARALFHSEQDDALAILAAVAAGSVEAKDQTDQLPSWIRALARERYLSLLIDDGASLKSVVDALNTIAGEPADYSRAVDRLLPAIVRARESEAVPELFVELPSDAEDARVHVAYVLGILDAEGFLPGEGDVASDLPALWRRPAFDYFRIAAAALAANPGGSHAAGTPRIPARERVEDARARLWSEQSGSAPIVIEPLSPEEPLALSLLHADALLSAGQVRPALALAMAAAREPAAAEVAVELARRFAALGHYSAGLDLARRAYARAELELEPIDVSILYPTAFTAEIDRAAGQYSISAAVLTGLVREESHFRPSAESWVGARGLAQIMPDTAADLARRLGRDTVDLDDPDENLGLSAYYLDYLSEQIDAPMIMIGSYNAGLGRGRRWEADFGDLPPALQIEALPFIETRWYVRRITVSAAVYQWLRDGTPVSEAFLLVLGGRL